MVESHESCRVVSLVGIVGVIVVFLLFGLMASVLRLDDIGLTDRNEGLLCDGYDGF